MAPCGPREDYLSWDEYFMSFALLTAKRSKDPNTQVGSVLVDSKKRVVGVGYNGMPWGCHDNEMPWGKNNEDPLHNKEAFVCHAEMNAVLNKNCAELEGSTLYSTLFPCNECAKIVTQARIKEVVFLKTRDCWKMEASRLMFDRVGIVYRQFVPARPSINLSFD